jgi:uncharacterized protein
MLADSLIVPECIYRPGSFTGLMTIYESNYIKLRPFTDGLGNDSDRYLSAETDDCDLHLEFVARERYTTTLRMTYWFGDASGTDFVPDPDLRLRVYHDARLVEAFGGRHDNFKHRKLRELAAATHAQELDRRWRRNIMLNKWLDYLMDVGHRFQAVR